MAVATTTIVLGPIDEARQLWPLPLLGVYQVVNYTLSIEGAPALTREHYRLDDHRYLRWLTDKPLLEATDRATLTLHFSEHFDKREPHLQDLARAAIERLLGHPPQGDKAINAFLENYIDAQDKIDDGEWGDAFLSFGTALEALLDGNLDGGNLYEFIERANVPAALKPELHFIRKLRNYVHPAEKAKRPEVSREDAVRARSALDQVLSLLAQL